jgi:acyl-CoA reductase-like NAD-dependent aldehyde dehydrogenase
MPESERVSDVVQQLECGTAWVNTHLAITPAQPFGGVKWSGVGVENGVEGFRAFTDLQVVCRPR